MHCQTKPIEVCRSGMEKEREKEFIGKNCDIVSTLYYASPPCKITAMNSLKNQTRYISHIYDFRLACHFSQSDRVKFHTHSENTLRVYGSVQVAQRVLCVRALTLTNETMANDLWSNLKFINH